MRSELTDAEHRMCELCWAFKNHRDVKPIHKGPARTFEALLGKIIAATGSFTWSSDIPRNQRFPVFNLDENIHHKKKQRSLVDWWVY